MTHNHVSTLRKYSCDNAYCAPILASGFNSNILSNNYIPFSDIKGSNYLKFCLFQRGNEPLKSGNFYIPGHILGVGVPIIENIWKICSI